MNHIPRTVFSACRVGTTTKRLVATMATILRRTTLVRGFTASSLGVPTTTTTTMDHRPFKILGVQQIAVGSTDKAALRHLWVDLLGCGPVQSSHVLEKENVDEDILRVGGGGDITSAVEVDLMSPIDPDKKPKVHDPPLNHIGLWVDALPAAVDWLTEQGVRFTPGGIRTGAAGYDVVFIHPKAKPEAGLPYSGQGVLIELVQAPPKVVKQE